MLHTIGSSPRARGTLRQLGGLVAIDRFIPAGAGNTRTAGPSRCDDTVHPRGRGEHKGSIVFGLHYSGSSPRARGTPGRGRLFGDAYRFIPAGAGNTRCTHCPFSGAAVHPRGRGEHAGLGSCPIPMDGSSPRARGTPSGIELAHDIGRFIPAGAGNTPPRTPAEIPSTVHPRGRGEHPVGRGSRPNRCGSSPRARGTLRRQS